MFHLRVCVCADKSTREQQVDEAGSSLCFSELEPETLYRISVHSRLGATEGTAVSILHPTGQLDRPGREGLPLLCSSLSGGGGGGGGGGGKERWKDRWLDEGQMVG